MAKKTSKQPRAFYEQLAGLVRRETPFVLPGSGDVSARAAETVRLLVSLGTALLEDLGYLIYRTGQRLGFLNRPPVRKAAIYTAALGAVAGTVTAGMLAATTLSTYAQDLANPNTLMNRNRVGTTILDRNGKILYRAEGADNRVAVKITDVPQEFINATLAAEDPQFYEHDGVSMKAITRALWRDITHGERIEGGSTLTQQLIKNTLLTPKKSLMRKFQEVVLALKLERQYEKDEILELYFNEVFYGQGSRGAERAARTYFHKSLSGLSLGETALLAGLPLGPSRFDPNFDPKAAKARRDFVLSQMEALGQITAKEEARAKAEPLKFFHQEIEIRAPHFVFYVLEELREQYGDELVSSGGITVHTTLDLRKQAVAEQEVRNQVSRLAYQHVTNGGLVALDPRTGEILAMVGSVDFNNSQFGKVNVTLSRLQPGSSFKPFAYATAFKKGYSGATQVQDRPMRVPDGSGRVYEPQNFDNRFRGPVLLRRALANSLNIPAVKVIEFAGIADTLETAKDMGITFLGGPERFGLSLALGSAEVKPLEFAEAYATFANLGKKVESRAIERVEDRFGEDITRQQQETEPQEVLDPRIAYMIIDILSDNQARSEVFGPQSPLLLPRPSFAKTGTTNDFRDNFTAGSTPDLTTVVWIGNNDHTPMGNVAGSVGAAPIWHNFMLRALGDSPELSFEQPDGLLRLSICRRDGGLANPWDTAIREFFLPEHKPTKRCSSKMPEPDDNEEADRPRRSDTFEDFEEDDPGNDDPGGGPGNGGGNPGGGGGPDLPGGLFD